MQTGFNTAQPLADIQNTQPLERVALPQVGIEAFRLPLVWEGRELETCVSASVCVPENQRGANLSRLTRGLYAHAHLPVGPSFLETLLEHYREALQAPHVHMRLEAHCPIKQKSLRSGLEGYQYYPVTYAGTLSPEAGFSWSMSVDYAYSSTCPCSAALAEQARQEHNRYATPHAQRSLARVRVHCHPGKLLLPKDLVAYCQKALPTELQVMVKREDEQAFAELNGAHTVFVEDALRRLYAVLKAAPEVQSFHAQCQHFESLHAHTAFGQVSS